MTKTRKFTNQEFEAITPLLDASLTASAISKALDDYDLDDDDIESMRDRLDDDSFKRLQHVHTVLEKMRGMTFDVPPPPAARRFPSERKVRRRS